MLVELCFVVHRNEKKLILEKIEKYYLKLGERFALALYNYYLKSETNKSGILCLDKIFDKSLSSFLNWESHGSLKWMQDLKTHDFISASRCLYSDAMQQSDLENKKVYFIYFIF